MSSQNQEKHPYVPPAQPVVIGEARGAENIFGGSVDDGFGFNDYNSR